MDTISNSFLPQVGKTIVFVGKTIVHKNVLITDTQPKGTKKMIKQTVLNNIFIQCGKGLQQNQYY